MAGLRSKKHLGSHEQIRPEPSAANGAAAVSRGVLNSWKEISTYTGRGIRTIQRYEAQFGLPVRRISGRKRTAVIAFTDEIDHWLRTRPQSIVSTAADENQTEQTSLEQAQEDVQKAHEAFRTALQRYLRIAGSGESSTPSKGWADAVKPYWREECSS